MQYAIVDGEKRKPFKGGKGLCPLCDAPLLAHSGEIEPSHWQHTSGAACDPWHEPETKWHRIWKDKYPKEWQEFPMKDEKTGEKHFADVKTNKGIVIEFQNSPITPSTIHRRETFYGNMVWVVNATNIKDNFVIASKVNDGIKRLDIMLTMQEDQIENKFKSEIKEQETKIHNLKEELNNVTFDKERCQKRIEQYQKYTEYYEELSNKIIRWIVKNEGYIEIENGVDLYDFLERSYKKKLLSTMDSICKDTAVISKAERELSNLTSLKDDEIDGKRFKKIPFDKISLDNYKRVFVIDRDCRNSLFHNHKEQRINNELELFRYKYSMNKFDFLIDLSEDISRLQQSICDLAADRQNHEQELEQVKATIAQAVIKWLLFQSTSLQKKLCALNIQIQSMSEEIEKEEAILDNLHNSTTERFLTAKKELERKHEKDKWEIMGENKGLYRFRWKREHKAWRAAFRPIFFDIGQDYLFEKMDDMSFRKVRIEEFIKNIRL